MKKQLSGNLTILVKIIIPAYWFLFWGTVGLMMLVGVDEKTKPPPALFFIFAVIGSAIMYFTAMKYMKVSADDKFLYVSNYLNEIPIPLSDIADVTQNVWVRGRPVTIHLKTISPFGRKIRFLPKSRGLGFLKSNPVIGELKEMAGISAVEDRQN